MSPRFAPASASNPLTDGRLRRGRVALRIVGLGKWKRIRAFRDGPRDATQFDVAISPDGERVAWVEIRANVVFGGVDFRRYAARFDGSKSRQMAADGGRPFVGWLGPGRIVREGFGGAYLGQTVDQGLCAPGPASGTNGTCTNGARQIAFDPAGRHLRHPSVSSNGRLVTTTAYVYKSDDMDTAIERPGVIATFDTITAAPVRDLTTGPNDLYPSFAPSGRAVAFERRGAVWVVPAKGGKARRMLRRARQPAWSK